jgi:hypothetical protein
MIAAETALETGELQWRRARMWEDGRGFSRMLLSSSISIKSRDKCSTSTLAAYPKPTPVRISASKSLIADTIGGKREGRSEKDGKAEEKRFKWKEPSQQRSQGTD